MSRSVFKPVLSLGVLVVMSFPRNLPAQECAEDGNQHTRGADVELSYAARSDDPQPKEKRYARAIEKLGPAFALDHILPRAYLLAGNAYLGLRDYAGADSMLVLLVQAEPACADVAQEIRFNAWVPMYNRGVNFLRSGDDAQALETFLHANVIYQDARSLTNAANIQQRNGDFESAMELYRQALDAGGEDEMVRAASINLAELLRAQDRNEEALAIYSDYSEAHPDDVLGRLNYAIALMDSEQSEAAQTIFEELMGRDDLNFRQWSQVGIGLYRAASFEEAGIAFRRAHELNPLNKETLENLANTYYQSEKYETLLPLADTLVQRYPYESMNYNLLANAHRELDDADMALEILQRRDGLAFEFLRSQLAPVSENLYSIEGQVINKKGEPGSEVAVPVELLGAEGQILTTEQLMLTLPTAGETSAFKLQIQVDAPVAGFRYAQTAAAGAS